MFPSRFVLHLIARYVFSQVEQLFLRRRALYPDIPLQRLSLIELLQ